MGTLLLRLPVESCLIVYLPFTAVAPGVREALRATQHPYREVYVGMRDTAYWELLSGLWSKGQTFAIVEHDIVVQPDSLKELEECPWDWCSFGAPYFRGVYHGLGCIKFGTELIKRHPGALEQVAAYPPDDKHPPKHWCRIDTYLQRALSGEYHHRHEAVLTHVKDEKLLPTHGCVAV